MTNRADTIVDTGLMVIVVILTALMDAGIITIPSPTN